LTETTSRNEDVPGTDNQCQSYGMAEDVMLDLGDTSKYHDFVLTNENVKAEVNLLKEAGCVAGLNTFRLYLENQFNSLEQKPISLNDKILLAGIIGVGKYEAN
jgi:hypothetical protein